MGQGRLYVKCGKELTIDISLCCKSIKEMSGCPKMNWHSTQTSANLLISGRILCLTLGPMQDTLALAADECQAPRSEVAGRC
jgi:hypothetical protein